MTPARWNTVSAPSNARRRDAVSPTSPTTISGLRPARAERSSPGEQLANQYVADVTGAAGHDRQPAVRNRVLRCYAVVCHQFTD